MEKIVALHQSLFLLWIAKSIKHEPHDLLRLLMPLIPQAVEGDDLDQGSQRGQGYEVTGSMVERVSSCGGSHGTPGPRAMRIWPFFMHRAFPAPG